MNLAEELGEGGKRGLWGEDEGTVNLRKKDCS